MSVMSSIPLLSELPIDRSVISPATSALGTARDFVNQPVSRFWHAVHVVNQKGSYFGPTNYFRCMQGMLRLLVGSSVTLFIHIYMESIITITFVITPRAHVRSRVKQ